MPNTQREPKVGDVFSVVDSEGNQEDELTIDEVLGQDEINSRIWKVSAEGDDYDIMWDNENDDWCTAPDDEDEI